MSLCPVVTTGHDTTGREVYKDDFVLILNTCPNCCKEMACGSPCDCCCKCNEKCKVKGRFGLAFVAETPCNCCCNPCGWEIEIIDTPSRVEQTCRDMMKWANAPPIETGDDCCCCSCCQKQGRKLRTCCCPPPPPECCCCPCPPKCCCPPKKCCCSPPTCCCPPKNSCCCPPKKPQRKCCCPKPEDPCCCQGRRCSFPRGDGDETTDDMYNDESPEYDEDFNADGENGDADGLGEKRSPRGSISSVGSKRASNASQRDGHPAGSPDRRSITSRDREHSHDRGPNVPRSREQSVDGLRSCLKKDTCNLANCPHKKSPEEGGEAFAEDAPNDDRQSISHDRQISAHAHEQSISHDRENSAHDRPSMSHDRPSMSHDIPSMSHDRQNSAHDRPSMSHDRQNSAHDRQTSAHDRPSMSHDRQNSAHDRPSMSHDRQTSAHDRPSMSHDDPNHHYPAGQVEVYHVQGNVHSAYRPSFQIEAPPTKQPPAKPTSNKKTSFFARLRSK